MYWIDDWAWGVPLIVLTVIVHTLALFGMRNRVVAILAGYYDEEHFRLPFALVMGATVLVIMVLLALEAALWARVYVIVGAQPDGARAMLYSLEAMTTFGHADVYLTPHWAFLGALEALGGVILIGLTTAFLFSLLRSAEVRRKQVR